MTETREKTMRENRTEFYYKKQTNSAKTIDM